MSAKLQLTDRTSRQLRDRAVSVWFWAKELSEELGSGEVDYDQALQRLAVMASVTESIEKSLKARQREAVRKGLAS